MWAAHMFNQRWLTLICMARGIQIKLLLYSLASILLWFVRNGEMQESRKKWNSSEMLCMHKIKTKNLLCFAIQGQRKICKVFCEVDPDPWAHRAFITVTISSDFTMILFYTVVIYTEISVFAISMYTFELTIQNNLTSSIYLSTVTPKTHLLTN